MPGTFADHIPSFLEYLKYEKRYSEHTIKSYRTDLEQLESYLTAQYGLRPDTQHSPLPMTFSEVQTPLLRSWLASLKLAGAEPRTINRKISAIKSFFRFHMRKGNLVRNPSSPLHVLKTNKRLPSFLKEDQTEEVVISVDMGDWKERTAALILEILYQTGLRVSELVALKERHIDEHLSQIKVLGKGNKERLIPVQGELLQRIKEYIGAKRSEFEGADKDVLLVGAGGRKLYPRYVYREVNERLKDLKQVTKKSPHVMRHTFATQLMNNGADLNAVKELLGHASLAATQVYTHNTIEKLKEVYKKAHPKG